MYPKKNTPIIHSAILLRETIQRVSRLQTITTPKESIPRALIAHKDLSASETDQLHMEKKENILMLVNTM
jgi:hypothetical protein